MRLQSIFILTVASLFACSQTQTQGTSDGGPGDAGRNGQGSSCTECVSTSDCSNHERCVMMNPASYCAAQCLSDSSCASGEKCSLVTESDGTRVSVCIPTDNSCGTMQQGTGNDGGPTTGGGNDAGPTTGGNDAGPTFSCNLYLPPQTTASCTCKAGKTCAPNGCYGGDYCNTNANPPYCAILPQSCGGPPKLTDALSVAGPVTANLNPQSGGTMDRLLFAVVGDTRASTEDDVSTYPTAVIQGIYSKLTSVTPEPAFVIATGDYAYSRPGSGTATQQYNIYLAAEAMFKGPFWPVMGNHECNGSTSSNCFPGDSSMNIVDWMPLFLQPLGESNVYYERDVNAIDGSWSAKFIFLAPNSWDSSQQSFLQKQLARKTTYTFVVRHEPSVADSVPGQSLAPGVQPIDTLLKNANVTLVIEGHSHTFFYYDYTDNTDGTEAFPKEVIVGNGGAPMTSMKPMGFTVFSQRPADNAIVLSAYDYTTGMAVESFAVAPDGHAIP